MCRFTLLACFAIVALAHAAPAPFLGKRDLPTTTPVGLEGEWALVSTPALAPSAPGARGGTLSVRGSTFTFCARPRGMPASYEAKLGEGGRLDLGGPMGATYLGFYSVSGGVLTLRYNAFNRPRPASIDARGPGYTEHYRRVTRAARRR
jgi:hypothetical protein